MKLLFLSQNAGFQGGLEQFQFQAAKLLRQNGFEIDIAYVNLIRSANQFLKVFNRKITIQQALEPPPTCDLAIIHDITDLALLEKITAHFPRLSLFQHGHLLHCPKASTTPIFSDACCTQTYSRLKCAVCAFRTPALPSANGLFGTFQELLFDFPKRIDIYKRIPLVFVLSQYMRDTLLLNGFKPEQVRILHPFICAPCKKQISHTSENNSKLVRLLLVGPITRNIGGELLIRILQLLRSDYRLSVVGEGSDRKRLQQLVHEAGLDNKVTFTGWQANMNNVYAKHDIVLMPSRGQEPFGHVGLEAAAHGLPVIAFDLGGCREYITDRLNGFLIKELDITSFAQRLDYLISNSDERIDMGNGGRAIATKFFAPHVFIKSVNRLMNHTLPHLFPQS